MFVFKINQIAEVLDVQHPHQTSFLDLLFRISDEIIIGQWCMFKKDLKKSKRLNVKHFLVGAITSFIYKTGKTEKEKQYTWESALIETPNLQALATWYHISKKR